MNKRGIIEVLGVALPAFIGLNIIGAIVLRGGIETYNNGVLKKNGQVIWCKMQQKGNDVCDTKYGHLGNGRYQ